MSKWRKSVVGVLVIATAIFVIIGCAKEPPDKQPEETDKQEGAMTLEEAIEYNNNLRFAEMFPDHWQSYQKNNEESMTKYVGSYPYNKNDQVNPLPEGFTYAQPYLKNLWLGYAFMYEYTNARGHTYALDDLLHVDRIDRYHEESGLKAACYNCKTSMMPAYLEEYGDAFWSMNFNTFREEQKPAMHSLGCTECHDAETMELVITSVPLNDALTRQGIDWREASKQEMRSYVCAQCHVEYYFESADHGVASKPHFPWDNGYSAQDMYGFYNNAQAERDGISGQFADWTHAVSEAKMVKIQHPEFETWIDSTHGKLGVSCADCHMGEVATEDGKEISAHHWTSPLKSLPEDLTCLKCHTGKDAEWAKTQVESAQDNVWPKLIAAQEESVRAHEAVRLAAEFTGEKHSDYEQLLQQAREYIREGQLYWDYVSAENSVGFHNQPKALETLELSQQASKNAQEAAKKATNGAISAQISGDIKEIVPPFLEHSRKLQQSQEHLDSHKWLQYLPLLPEADLMWDGTERLRE